MPDELLSITVDEPYILVTPEQKAKTAKEAGHALEVLPAIERSYIIVVASHKEKSRNIINRVSYKKGIPLGGYVYDAQTESYQVECADYLHLGFVPVSFVARMKGVEHWEMRVPMPESVLKKYLTTLQKRELRNFKSHFKAEEYDIQYIQMLDPN
jgi:hypothetical protein